MANPKRKVFRKKKAVRRIARTSARVNNPGFRKARKRRKNAVVVIRKVSRNRAHMHFRRKARRNPEFLGGSFMGILTDFFALAGGGIGARSIPQILFTSLNTGFIGYGMNFATAFALSWLIGKKYPQKARMVFLGGTAFTLSRIVDDYFGTQLIQFAQINPGATPLLSGDAGYGIGLAGVFKNLNYVIPSPIPGSMRPALPPAPAAANTGAAPAKTGVGRVRRAYGAQSYA